MEEKQKANLNMWKTVFQRNLKFFEKYYSGYDQLSDIKKSRYGLYLFVLASMFDIDNKQEFEKHILDCEFNKTILKNAGNDNKVDAIYIDDEEKKIYFMNFNIEKNIKKTRDLKAMKLILQLIY